MAHTRKKMLEKLGLLQYQHHKITLKDARQLPFNLATDSGDVPMIMIEKLMRVDFRFRDKSIPRNPSPSVPFHIMDIFILVFTSCNMLLQEMLVQKMALCRMAMPFIIPFSDGKLQLTLWPLRSIVLEWINKDEISMEASLVKQPFKIVSFVRVSDLQVSKSVILNEVMSTQIKDTFYHRECSGGNKKRSITNGLVEMSYFLPSDSNLELNEEILFLNLRDNVQSHSKQCSALCKISSVIVCVVSLSKLADNSVISTLSNIHGKCSNVIVLVTCKQDDAIDPKQLSKIDRSKFTIVKNFDNELNEISLSDFTFDVRNVLADKLRAQSNTFVLENGKEIFKQSGIIIDEDHVSPFTTKQEDAFLIIEQLKDREIATAKEEILPLQGELLHKWTAKLKMKHRGKDVSIDVQKMQQEKSDIDDEMQHIRKQQLNKAKKLHAVVEKFINKLKDCVERDASIFYKWLQLEFDEISRSVIPGLRQDYQVKWDHRKKDPNALKEAEKKLDESSFGLEHLFREIGQLYECIKQSPHTALPEQVKLSKVLPEIAAQYLLSGHPLEIMDGDTGVVPTTWVTSVLETIDNIISGKKMFVLSVVGVQSSGKSTLLNTMFGLELAVGAGRCTRGIFAQLLAVDCSKFNVDYILVLDSEGLCGIERVDEYDHDNEIATLVIGLADLTIVNTKGENYQQMQHILEIAVHAFLRMKSIKNFKTQKCLFVHQSVSSPGAQGRLVRDRRKLQESLDNMAKQASEYENLSPIIDKFKQVIDFDCEKNVFYIPDIWSGTPPMAQVKTGYSDKVLELRKFILKEIGMAKYSATTREMQIRIEDMWNGVLADDFLFSFQNSISVKAYLQLEKEFYKIMRDLESKLIEYINNTCKLALEQCETKENLDSTFKSQKTALDRKGKEISDKCRDRLSRFFDEGDLKQYVKTWRKGKENEFSLNAKQILGRVKVDLQNLFNLKSEELDLLLKNKPLIISKAQITAQNMKGESTISKETIKQQFDNFWSGIENVIKISTKPVVNVKEEMMIVLEEIFKKHGWLKYLKDEMAQYSDPLDIDIDIFLSKSNMKKDYLFNKNYPVDAPEVGRYNKPTVLIPKQKPRETFFEDVVKETNNYLQEIKDKFSAIMSEKGMFFSKHGHELIESVRLRINNHNELSMEESEFTLTPLFEAMLALRVARMAVSEYEKRIAQSNNWINARKEAFKKQLYNLFANTVQEKMHELPVDLLVDLFKEQIIGHVQDNMTREAVDRVLRRIKYTKNSLLIEVLTSLAKESSFDDYMAFANDMYIYCTGWIKTETEKILLEKDNGTSEFTAIVKKYLDAKVKEISKAVDASLKDTSQFPAFIDSFYEKIKSSLTLVDSDRALLKTYEVKDTNSFKQSFELKLKKMEKVIINSFNVTSFEDNVWNEEPPYKQVMAKLWGCREKCPCCQSPCMFTGLEHLDEHKHKCIQHWPGGFTGTMWTETEDLTTEICSFLISSGASFKCSACRYVCRGSGNCDADTKEVAHPFKEYKKYIKNWEIDCDDAGEASLYWQWMMATFPKELVAHHKARDLKIPSSWHIDKEKAIESLYKYSDGGYKRTTEISEKSLIE